MISVELKKRFFQLAVQLEPENLYQDGERSMAEAGRVARRIRAEWKKLEAEAGCKVSDGEPFVWHQNGYK